MRHSIYRRQGAQDAFTDLLFNALLAFAFMFVAAFALMADPSQTGDVASKAEVLITVRWPDDHPDDVDTLVEDPNGNLVWYHNRDAGLMHLDRDDRGAIQDRILIDGRQVANPLNQETVSIRTLQAGEIRGQPAALPGQLRSAPARFREGGEAEPPGALGVLRHPAAGRRRR